MELDDDDWLFESIRKYKNLSMYDLQKRIPAMDWVDNQGLCVATSNSANKSEILELKLPDKLLSADKISQGLKKDRDFRVQTGGFCSSPVSSLKHIPNTRKLLTSHEDRKGLTVWSLGDENTDLIQSEEEIICSRPMLYNQQFSVCSEGADVSILHGTCTKDLTCIDLKTKQPLHDFTDIKQTVDRGQGVSSRPCLSVSGFNGSVALYDIPIEKHAEKTEPFFVHTGHTLGCHGDQRSSGVTGHMWYPWQHDLILSADRKGSLHAWQYSMDFIHNGK